MQILCQNCHIQVEFSGDESVAAVTCPACGSTIEVVSTQTISWDSVENRRSLGKYEVIGLLGSGSFGVVYKARDTELDRIVALKIPRSGVLSTSEDRVRFTREARSAARLRHPGVVPVYDAGVIDDVPFICSEFVQGTSLAEHLKNNRPGFEESATLIADLADILQVAHEQGIVHRDVKPSNILMAKDGPPRLMDFGLAKRMDVDGTITLEGQVIGTPAYMSPEQAEGQAHKVDGRSDVYSLGAVLYELLTGRRPFQGKSRESLKQLLHQDPVPPRKVDTGIPKNLETICLKAMEKRPEERYASSGEFAADLRNHLEGRPIQARSIDVLRRFRRQLLRPSSAYAVAVIVLVALIGLAIFPDQQPGNSNTATASHNQNGKDQSQQNSSEVDDPSPPVSQTNEREIVLKTKPVGAEIVLVPLSDRDGKPDGEQAIYPGKTIAGGLRLRAPPGHYLVVANIEGFGFHEVYRIVPEKKGNPSGGYWHQSWEIREGRIELPEIEIKSTEEVLTGMVAFRPGAVFQVGKAEFPNLSSSPAPPHNVTIAPFALDATEFTVAQYRELRELLPVELRDKQLDDRTAVSYVTFDEAVFLAEQLGKRLPTEIEYEFAATNLGQTEFPWGDDVERIEQWTFGTVGMPVFDKTETNPPVFGLYSNVAEWTSSWISAYPVLYKGVPLTPGFSDARIVRGGPTSVVVGNSSSSDWVNGPRWRHGFSRDQKHPGLGFRCARSIYPHFLKPSTSD